MLNIWYALGNLALIAILGALFHFAWRQKKHADEISIYGEWINDPNVKDGGGEIDADFDVQD